MSREHKYTAIVLKKQPFKEGDEIITFFTREQGKVRALAKSVKSPKSKLQQKLQSLFLVDLILSGGPARLGGAGKLPKIIFAEPKVVFAGLRQNLQALKMAFYAAELSLKFTPDEHKNESLFGALASFLGFIDNGPDNHQLNAALAKFKLEALTALGLSLNYPARLGPEIFFSSSHGGFTAQKFADASPVSRGVYAEFMRLKNSVWGEFPGDQPASVLAELQNLLSRFIEYQLERKLNSEKFLNML